VSGVQIPAPPPIISTACRFYTLRKTLTKIYSVTFPVSIDTLSISEYNPLNVQTGTIERNSSRLAIEGRTGEKETKF